jgi:hypothetical protein
MNLLLLVDNFSISILNWTIYGSTLKSRARWNQWWIYKTCSGWATTKEKWAALHYSITTVQIRVLNWYFSEISGWATTHRAHPVDPPLDETSWWSIKARYINTTYFEYLWGCILPLFSNFEYTSIFYYWRLDMHLPMFSKSFYLSEMTIIKKWSNI